MCYYAVRCIPVIIIFEVINMSIKITDETRNNIIKLRTETDMTFEEIGNMLGISVSSVYQTSKAAGLVGRNRRHVVFTTEQEFMIIAAHNGGTGLNGMSKKLGFNCPMKATVKVLEKHGLKPRNRSEQQQARMDNSSPEEIAKLVNAANEAARGTVRRFESKAARAKTMEGFFNKRSKYEPLVFNAIIDYFPNAIPSKAVDVYNLDIGIGNVAVEVFGGSWSVSDRGRITKYIERTKKLGELGINTVFVIFAHKRDIIDTEKLVESINILSSNPPSSSQYRVIWGDSYGSSGLCSDIDDSAFVCPFVNVRDTATGRYKSVPR